jgi:hypothetical protein
LSQGYHVAEEKKKCVGGRSQFNTNTTLGVDVD